MTGAAQAGEPGGAGGGPEIWFYHLLRQPLERALPTLLERARQRGWKAVVQATTRERVAALDELLWTYAEDSFLPHGADRDGSEAGQPIWLTDGPDNPNGADIRLMADGADPLEVLDAPGAAPSQRLMVLFDGNDPDALGIARMQFRSLRARGLSLSYWRQNEQGRWEKNA